MKVAVLGSGSRGNATLVVADSATILVDAGFSGRQLALRMRALGVDPDRVDALVVTHEHADHVRGAGIFARRHGTPVYIADGTRAACADLFRGTEEMRGYRPGHPFLIGRVRVDPFLTAHDAVDPVAVTLECGDRLLRVGIATDLGRPTAGIRHSLRNCHLLILEANHDEGLLRTGPYPPSVQGRIASSHGHLSNHAAAAFARELLHPQLCGVVLAHLSQECNRPELAAQVVRDALQSKGFHGPVDVAGQDEPTQLFDLDRLRDRAGPSQLSLL